MYPSEGYAPDGFVRVIYHRSLFDTSDRREVVVPVGMSLSEILNDELGVSDPGTVAVAVADKEVASSVWAHTVPSSGALVRFYQAPGLDVLFYISMAAIAVSIALTIAGAVTGNQYLMIAGAAVGVLGMGVGVWAGTASGTITAAQVSAQALVGGLALGAANIAAGLISAAQSPKGRTAAGRKNSYHLKGARNQTRQFDPVPKIFGKVRTAPAFGQLPYSRSEGGTQYFYARLIVGTGPVLISDIKIGETSLYDFSVNDSAGTQSLLRPLDDSHPTDGATTYSAGWKNRRPWLVSGDFKFGSSENYDPADDKIWMHPWRAPTQRGDYRQWHGYDIVLQSVGGNSIYRRVVNVTIPPHPTDSITTTVVGDVDVEMLETRHPSNPNYYVPLYFGAARTAKMTWVTVVSTSEFQVNDWIEVAIKDDSFSSTWASSPIGEVDAVTNTSTNRKCVGAVRDIDAVGNRILFDIQATYSAANEVTIPNGATIQLCWGEDNVRNGAYTGSGVAFRHWAYIYAGRRGWSQWDNARLYNLDKALGAEVEQWLNVQLLGSTQLQVRHGFPGEPPATLIPDSVVLEEFNLLVLQYRGSTAHGTNGTPIVRTTQEETNKIRLTFNTGPQYISDPDGDPTVGANIAIHVAIRETGTSTYSNGFRIFHTNDAGSITEGSADAFTFSGEGSETSTKRVTLPGSKTQLKTRAFQIVPDDASPSSGNQYDVKVGVENWVWTKGKIVHADVRWVGLESSLAPGAIDETGLAEIQLRLKSSDTFDGVLDTITCEAQSLLGYYDGSEWVDPTASMTRDQLDQFVAISSNPAWQVADVMRGNGAAKPVADSFVDGDSLKAFADWCDAPYTGKTATTRRNVDDNTQTNYPATATAIDLAWDTFLTTRDDLTMTEKIPATASAYTSEFWLSELDSPATDFDNGQHLHVTLRRPIAEASAWSSSDWSYKAEIVGGTTGQVTATNSGDPLTAGEWVTLHWDFSSFAGVTTANACTIKIYGLTDQSALGPFAEITSGWTGHTTAQISRIWVDDSATGNGTAVYDHKTYERGRVEDPAISGGSEPTGWSHQLDHASSPLAASAHVQQLPSDAATFVYNGLRTHRVQFVPDGGTTTDTAKATGSYVTHSENGPGYRLTLDTATTADISVPTTVYELFVDKKCNAVVDYQTTSGELMEQFAAVGWGSVRYEDGKLGITIDKPRKSSTGVVETPATLITPRNVKAGSVSGVRFYPEIAHATRVNFANDSGDSEERIVYRPGYGKDAADSVTEATVFDVHDTWGITDADQAFQHAKFNIVARDQRSEIVTAEMDIENFFVQRGDVVEFGHDVPMLGTAYGRLTATTEAGGNLATITLDETMTLEYGKSYGVRIRQADGSFTNTGVSNTSTEGSPVETKTLTVTGTVASADAPVAGDLVVFGELGVETSRMIVVAIEPTDELSAKFAMVPEAPEIWDALREGTNTMPAYSAGASFTAETKPNPPRILGWLFGPDYIELFVAPAAGSQVITRDIEGAWLELGLSGSERTGWSESTRVRASGATSIKFDWPRGSNAASRNDRNFRFRAVRADSPVVSSWVQTDAIAPDSDDVFEPKNVRVSHVAVSAKDSDLVASWEVNVGDGIGDALTVSEKGNRSAVMGTLGEDPLGSQPSAADDFVKSFRVAVTRVTSGYDIAPDGGASRNSDEVASVVAREVSTNSPATTFTYTLAMNAEDHGGAAVRGPFEVRVRPIVAGVIQSAANQSDWAISSVSAPPPGPAPTITRSEHIDGMLVEFPGNHIRDHSSITGVIVWALQEYVELPGGETVGYLPRSAMFSPTTAEVVYAGPISAGYGLSIPLTERGTYRLRYAYTDGAWTGERSAAGTNLDISDEQTFFFMPSRTPVIADGDTSNLIADPNFSLAGEQDELGSGPASVFQYVSLGSDVQHTSGDGTVDTSVPTYGGWEVVEAENSVTPQSGKYMLRHHSAGAVAPPLAHAPAYAIFPRWPGHLMGEDFDFEDEFSGSAGGGGIPVVPGEKYYYSFDAYRTADSDPAPAASDHHVFVTNIYYYDREGRLLTEYEIDGGAVDTVGSGGLYEGSEDADVTALTNNWPAGSWKRFEGWYQVPRTHEGIACCTFFSYLVAYIGGGTSVTDSTPDTMVLTIRLSSLEKYATSADNGGDGAPIYFDNFVLRRMASTELIAEDAVTNRVTDVTTGTSAALVIEYKQNDLALTNPDTFTRPAEITWAGEFYRGSNLSTNTDFSLYFRVQSYRSTADGGAATTTAVAWGAYTSTLSVVDATGFDPGDTVLVAIHPTNGQMTMGWVVSSTDTVSSPNTITFTASTFWGSAVGSDVLKIDEEIFAPYKRVPANYTTGTNARQTFSFSAVTEQAPGTVNYHFSHWNNGNNLWQNTTIASGCLYDIKLVKK